MHSTSDRALDPLDAGFEGAPWQAPDRITCHLHDTLIEHCIDEHGLELLEPAAPRHQGEGRP